MGFTRLALVLLALAGGCEIAGLWLENGGLRALAALVLVSAIAGLALEYAGRGRRVPEVRVVAAAVTLGETATLRVTLTTRSARAVPVEYLPSVPAAVRDVPGARRLDVRAGAATTDAYSCVPCRLGRHALPRLRLRVVGALGLAWWPAAVDTGATLVVRPALLSAHERRRAGAGGGGRAQALATGSGELHQLRPYRQGDSTRSIDWRATARTGHLVTREYALEDHLEIVLMIDAGRYSRLGIDGNDRLGHYAHVAVRFAERAALADDRVGIIVFADRVLLQCPPARGAVAVRAVRDALTSVESLEVESDLVGAALAAQRLAKTRSLIVLFTDLDDSDGMGSLGRAVALLRARHVPLVAGLGSSAIHALGSGQPTSLVETYVGLAADVYEDARDASLSHLRRRGVPAVCALPANFERAVLRSYDLLRARRSV